MLVFFTVVLLVPYCLLVFNVSFFSDIICNVVLSNALLLCWNFYIIFFISPLFMLHLLKIGFQSIQQKSFYINLFVWQLIGNLAYFLNFKRFDLFKHFNRFDWQHVCNFGFYVHGFNIFDYLKLIYLERPMLSRNRFGIKNWVEE